MQERNEKKILLVEDFEDNRFMLRHLLEMSGYKVIEACDGKQAVDIASRDCPDLVLMDLSLPVMDGIHATRFIRQIENLCDVPIVIVSAYDTNEFRELARQAGCDAYVTKPIDYDKLDSLIETLLEEETSNISLVA
jgi:two-component system, cell cycle response regulator DivK